MTRTSCTRITVRLTRRPDGSCKIAVRIHIHLAEYEG
jgi:hypothetical protein